MKFKKKNKIYQKAKKVVASEILTWREKYNLIFSDDISANFTLDYYDPDTSYKEDVLAFMSALDEYMEEQRAINCIDGHDYVTKFGVTECQNCGAEA